MSIHDQKDHYAAIEDVHVNLENRNHAFEEYGYGPLNPKEPSNDFWKQKAKVFNTSVEEAKKSRCGNCAAFNQSKEISSRIANGLGPAGKVITEKADLGFCELFKFKCAAERTCDAWLVNGPINEGISDYLPSADSIYAFGRNAADTATFGTYKYARAGADYAIKNAASALGYGKGTSYNKELDQEKQKLARDDIKNPQAAAAGDIAGYAALAVAPEIPAVGKTLSSVIGGVEKASKVPYYLGLAKKAVGLEEEVNVAGKTLYRGNSKEHSEGGNPLGTYLTTDKEFASGYGKITAHKIPENAKIFDMDDEKNAKLWHPHIEKSDYDMRNFAGDKVEAFSVLGYAKGDYDGDAELYQQHRDRFINAGYDGVSLSHGMDPGHTRVFMFNKKKIKEEMSAGSGMIAGIGIGPQGEPGRPAQFMPMQRRKTPRGKFMNNETFIVPHSTFISLKEAKKKNKHWKTYLNEDDSYHDIREYAKSCKGPIIVEDERTGAMMYIRYGKGGSLHEAWTNKLGRESSSVLSRAGGNIKEYEDELFIKKLGNYDETHSVYKHEDFDVGGLMHHYYLVHNETGHITHSVNGPMKKGVLKGVGAGSSEENKKLGTKIKMEDFYHHLLKSGAQHEASGSKERNQYPVALVGTNHSGPSEDEYGNYGAQNVWRNLAKKERMTVHGFIGGKKGKAINIGKAEDPSETHADPHVYDDLTKNPKKGADPERTRVGKMALVAAYDATDEKPEISRTEKITVVRRRGIK